MTNDNTATKYAVIRVGSRLDAALLKGCKKQASPLYSTFDRADTARCRSAQPALYRIAEIG